MCNPRNIAPVWVLYRGSLFGRVLVDSSQASKAMYTDPGSGLFFLQIIAAAFLTLLYRFRKSLFRIWTAIWTKT